jgi:hypothetical protein
MGMRQRSGTRQQPGVLAITPEGRNRGQLLERPVQGIGSGAGLFVGNR